ncbi:hypothetical protein ACF0A6_08310, partial [Acinetobacter baumannii]
MLPVPQLAGVCRLYLSAWTFFFGTTHQVIAFFIAFKLTIFFCKALLFLSIHFSIRSITLIFAGLGGPFSLLFSILITALTTELTGWLITRVVAHTTPVVRVMTPMMRI